MRWLLLAVLVLVVSGVSFYLFPRDQQLTVTPVTIQKLQALRQSDTFADLPSVNIVEEKIRLQGALNELLGRLISGLETHPNKLWVIEQMKPTVQNIYLEDTEGRERFVNYLGQIMGITGIVSTNGAFIRYFIFI